MRKTSKLLPAIGAMALVAALSTAARAERIAPVPGEYFAENPAPEAGSSSALACPGVAQVNGTTLSFPLQVYTNAPVQSYGTLKVPLDATGQFHGKITLPPRGAWTRKPGDSGVDDRFIAFRDAKEVMVDASTAAVGGAPGAASLSIRVVLPLPDPENPTRESPLSCSRSLLNIKIPKVAKTSPYDGWYGARSGGGKGDGLRCPDFVVVSGGKVYFGVTGAFNAWAVVGQPLAKNGVLDLDTALAKMPSDDELRSVGYYDETVGELSGGLSFHVHLAFEDVFIAHQQRDTKNLTLKAESDGISECNSSYYLKGVDFGGGFIDCSKLSAEERKVHAVCH